MKLTVYEQRDSHGDTIYAVAIETHSWSLLKRLEELLGVELVKVHGREHADYHEAVDLSEAPALAALERAREAQREHDRRLDVQLALRLSENGGGHAACGNDAPPQRQPHKTTATEQEEA